MGVPTSEVGYTITTHHRDNVVALDGRPNLRSRLQYRHNQGGKHESSYEHVVTLGGDTVYETKMYI